MKLLGIDYGTKRMGLAISDDTGSIAFPKGILRVTTMPHAIEQIIAVSDENAVDAIVVGMPDNEERKSEIELFSKALRAGSGKEIYFINESFTSFEAFKGTHDIRQEQGRNARIDNDPKDDVAASLILQRFLDSRVQR